MYLHYFQFFRSSLLSLFTVLSLALCSLQAFSADQEVQSTPEVKVKNRFDRNESAYLKRRELEHATDHNPFAITPHKPNYMLPATYNFTPGKFSVGGKPAELENEEMKFQISFKILIARNLFEDNVSLHFGYTNNSFWQAYNSEISAPFRDTNHEPELMLTYYNPVYLGPIKVHSGTLGFSHQSNGNSAELSRSWNRLYLQFIAEYDHWYFMFKPWYRLPEQEKRSINDIKGDDNPDILDFMGHFELRAITFFEKHSFDIMLRNNLRSDNKGAFEFGWTFPISQRLRGYTQIFTGYGESMLDYNESTTRIGFGIMMTNWL